MILELKSDERSLLAELLLREISDIGPEIHHTASSDYRENLRIRRRVLQGLVDRLGLVETH